MQSLLIINKSQFGYHTDTYELSKQLKEQFNITYLCFDAGQPKLDIAGINVKYISFKGSYLKKGLRFIAACISEVKKDYNFIFLVYFLSCSFIKLTTAKNIILDFRTGAVNRKKWRRQINDLVTSFEAKVFPHVTVISEGLRKLLKIPKSKSSILPLGANILSEVEKAFKAPKLFYIGTLNNRNIGQTIKGIALFLDQHPNYKQKLKYNIVGSGFNNEEQALKQLIVQLGLENNIITHGRKSHNDVQYLFDSSNVGVSYVPMTDYYDHQPPTKTYEYILSGMACLATATSENKKLINKKNGILINDTAESFADGLEELVNDFESFNSESIKQTLADRTWESIAKDFKGMLQNQTETK